uniref:Uncharacterized protein n=1 Tax=Vespula pensylvanica TaxID=30213 RepID=A0A834UB49_VESPE|nr:hypothetical protein H0235_007003 [Vespula pensylvanica]
MRHEDDEEVEVKQQQEDNPWAGRDYTVDLETVRQDIFLAFDFLLRLGEKANWVSVELSNKDLKVGVERVTQQLTSRAPVAIFAELSSKIKIVGSCEERVVRSSSPLLTTRDKDEKIDSSFPTVDENPVGYSKSHKSSGKEMKRRKIEKEGETGHNAGKAQVHAATIIYRVHGVSQTALCSSTTVPEDRARIVTLHFCRCSCFAHGNASEC